MYTLQSLFQLTDSTKSTAHYIQYGQVYKYQLYICVCVSVYMYVYIAYEYIYISTVMLLYESGIIIQLSI
jgi:hypothetical protein